MKLRTRIVCRFVILSGFLSIAHAQFPDPRVLIFLKITDGTETVYDTLGWDLQATYCIDGTIDTNLVESELPPLPVPAFDARFVDHRLDSCRIWGLRVHIQEWDIVDTFRLQLTPSAERGFPITITWQGYEQGLVKLFFLRVGIPGEDSSTYTDMLTDSVFVVHDFSMATLDIIGVASSWDAVELGDKGLPLEPTLYQNYPNPFNPQTTIRHYLPDRSPVTLVILDMLGRVVYERSQREPIAGYYSVDFNATGLASGVYSYSLRSDSRVLARKLLYIK
jgi:hypothetical protein